MSGKPAARLGDPTACPIPGHGTNPIAAGSPDVLFDSLPAARMGDASACGGAMAGAVTPTVLINGKPAAVLGSVGSHGNVVIGGSGTVIIGNTHTPPAFVPPTALAIASHSQCILVEDQDGNPLQGIPYRLRNPQGEWIDGYTDSAGRTQRIYGNAGDSIDFSTAIQEELS
ncbi:PAAR domain-containing protein [Stutzerimonas stutzeri]|uniref:PAAR domain-containing protein n=1 Tax=Stutzerimonas stutzeri TaxID=316 RepID=UPI001C2EEAFD|nr:PAAR domain-containing protein [Stutzerimonas stutzeri]